MTLDLPSLKATIAIPLFNSAATVHRCLSSAMAQTLDDIEILVVDDASTDEGAAIVATLAKQDARIRLIRLSSNGGKARAMNLMMQQARGRWFAVLDADDAYRPERLARLIAAAEALGVEMVADNILYIDTGAGCTVQSAFPLGGPDRIFTKADLPAHSSSFAEFDFGILKPVVRVDFARKHLLEYLPDTKLAEDFYYLMEFLVEGARLCLCSEPMYEWSMPFGPVSRQWAQTGNGAWRYDYRNALVANRIYMNRMAARGEIDMVRMLERRARQYGSMVHYIDAQKAAAAGRPGTALLAILGHPSTYLLLARRIAGRLRRALRSKLAASTGRSAQVPA